jgi:small subunit ribosomal protein S15Ae
MQARPSIGEFEAIDDLWSGQIVIRLFGQLNKWVPICPGFGVALREPEPWQAKLLPSRQFGYVVLTMSRGFLDHEAARF